MDKARQNAEKGRDREYFEDLYRDYDKTLRLSDFMRRYYPRPVRSIPFSEEALEDAFRQLGKMDDVARSFDCGACGSDTCRSMAIKIARKINIPENCIHKVHAELQAEVAQVLDWQHNAESILTLQKDSARIKDFADTIVSDLHNVKTAIDHYEVMTKDINKIASNIHMISLNASIEAARAGVHGRPFSVVAEAIHKLARETQKAILEITSTSEETKKAIEDISKMVGVIRNDITKSHDNISKLTDSTQHMLKTGGAG
ncbi:MAG: methyl-accepting chemotaxis protein [Deltaproteobacteria bacterium]|jgi:hypothetical protein|nr:methyl-accepting chemotaxis protein [Deltaproteobacteria bacterium]